MTDFQKLIGNTPMIRIRYKLEGRPGCVYAKLESYNLSGSIKDRMAAHILIRAKAQGALKEGQPMMEVTSGNTGIAFAALGALTRHPVHIYMPDWVSEERRRLLDMYGAQLHLVSAEEGGFEGALVLAERAAKELGAFRPMQFSNRDNCAAHYLGTGPEIYAALPDVDAFVAGVGSGGTIMGTGRFLKEYRPGFRVAAVEPDAMPILSGGSARGSHMIEGVGDSFIPEIVDRAMFDRVHTVNDRDAVAMAALIARRLGIGVGISSGANFLGAVMEAEHGGKVATVFPDDNKKYLTTTLSHPEDAPNGLSSRIELIDYEAL